MAKLTDRIIFDIKGDMCRLGYLKILTMISDDNENYDLDYHAGLLEEQVTEDEEPKEYLIKPLKDNEKKTIFEEQITIFFCNGPSSSRSGPLIVSAGPT